MLTPGCGSTDPLEVRILRILTPGCAEFFAELLPEEKENYLFKINANAKLRRLNGTILEIMAFSFFFYNYNLLTSSY